MGQSTIETLSLSTLLDSTIEGVFALDADRRFILFNKACERLTGWRAEELLQKACQCSAATHCRDEQGRSLSGMLCPGMAVFEGRAPALRQRMQIQSRNGESRWVETQYTAVRDVAGRPQCIIGVMRDDGDTRERERGWRDTIESLRQEISQLREQQQQRFGFTAILTRSPAMQAVLDKIDAACATNSPVLIIGEAGTGKELVARTIHQHSPRSQGAFISLSAAALPRETQELELFGTGPAHGGSYAAAEAGTLLLEDIESLSDSVQLRLLHAIQDRRIAQPGQDFSRPIDVRLMATTHRSMGELIASGLIRQDLHYRLGAITIELPPLRSRPEDIPLLVRHFLDELSGASTRMIQEVEPAVWQALGAHHWPGNIRELYGVIESAFTSAREGRLQVEDLHFWPRMPAAVAAPMQQIQLDERIADIERRTILAAIRQAGGQRNLAAKLMGISRSRLYRRMDALGIDPDQDA